MLEHQESEARKLTKIVHILLGADRGGCEANSLCLIREAAGVSHQVMILGPPGEMTPEMEAAGATVTHLDSARRRRSIRSLARKVLEDSVDGVVIWHGMVCLPEILAALRDFSGTVLVHGGNPANNLSSRTDLRFLIREKWLGRRAQATYVCCTRYVADSFQRSAYLKRFPVVVVPNGIKNPPALPYAPREIIAGVSPVIGMVARLDAIKDHRTLLQAFSLLLAQWPGARLELAGDGDQREALESHATRLGISANVAFLGMVPDVYHSMRHWDLFAYCTTEMEGLGNALAEAMAYGLPCIASEVGPVREVGENSIHYVPQGDPTALRDAMVRLMNDFKTRQALGSMARERALEQFSARSFARKYVSLIRADHDPETIRPEDRDIRCGSRETG
ncbi:glycosyltransferase [Luteolibacter flavescens]|uniref:Glycosyltransferase n=1 Tax=Luteolibacter flavescens TaxID=1859460 RepID=A0ABT3FVR6_9BACT|nr:glycosyltransferase [Luteolibacter flavescens]MCW1887314.1 glycosyltransferase [Luteolibacter flavescens]